MRVGRALALLALNKGTATTRSPSLFLLLVYDNLGLVKLPSIAGNWISLSHVCVSLSMSSLYSHFDKKATVKMEEGDGIEPLTFRLLQFSRLCEEPTSAPSLVVGSLQAN